MGQQRYVTADPAPRQVWEERDRMYSDGRRITIDEVTANRVIATCTRYEKRPDRVGATVRLHQSTLRQKWTLVLEAS